MRSSWGQESAEIVSPSPHILPSTPRSSDLHFSAILKSKAHAA
jgi:hypothetical protein